MQYRFFRKTAVALLAIAFVFLFMQCDIILGSGDNANVGIDLSAFYEEGGRAITNIPPGITGFKVSVFGPGMQRIEKTISAGTRYVNMSVPAGEDRYFTVEAFFSLLPDSPYQYFHLRSYKGRAIANLRPGRFTGLYFRMSAGSTALLLPDFLNQRIYQANNLSFSDIIPDSFSPSLHPADLDIDTSGRIFIAGRWDGESVEFATNIYGTGQGGTGSYQSVNAIAIDRDTNYDIDHLGVIDTNVIYFYSEENTSQLCFSILDGLGPYTTYVMQLPGINFIRGIAVDPWTHRVYMVGQITAASPQEAIIEYDPFYATYTVGAGWQYGQVVRMVTHAQFRLLNDVIVKDDGIFVLNETPVSEGTLPVLLRFNRALTLTGTFGHLSTDGEVLIPSTAAGAFYHPKRFIAQENEGLYIIDDSNVFDDNDDTYDKIIRINTDMSAGSWQTYPPIQPVVEFSTNYSGEPFFFFE